MARDLTLLRVACRFVERCDAPASSPFGGSSRDELSRARPALQDAARIPQLYTSSVASGGETRPPADSMLGLQTLAAHADKQPPIMERVHLMQRLAGPMARNPEGVPLIPACVAPVPFVCYLGKKNKRGEPRFAQLVGSPTSVWEEDSAGNPASPLMTTTPSSHSRPGPTATLMSWRAPMLHPVEAKPCTVTLAPLEQRTPLPRAPTMLPVAGNAAKRPMLVRRMSVSNWRQQTTPLERSKTRGRIQKGLDDQCQGDYEMLLRVISALDEELLHIRTNSKDHYAQQTHALRDQIERASLNR